MIVGLLLELFLLSHYEDVWQTVPIIVVTVTLVVFIGVQFVRDRMLTRLFELCLWVCALSGFLGIYFHFSVN